MDSLRETTQKEEPKAKTFEEVLAKELDLIPVAREERRKALGEKINPGPPPAEGNRHVYERAHKMRLVGLAFSGGGIRSATFSLGVLQGLARMRVLGRFDYLSTVSGGGYIGSWLAAWIRNTNLNTAMQGLGEKLPQDDHGKADGGKERQGKAIEPAEIRWLRQYSNYLTPRLGLASGDTWAVVGSYVRNLLLNQVILFLMLTALLLAVLVPVAGFRSGLSAASPNLWKWAYGLLALAVTTIVANVSAFMRVEEIESWAARRPFRAGPRGVHLLALFPTLAGAAILWAWWWKRGADYGQLQAALWGGGLFAALWAAGWGLGWLTRLLRGGFKGTWSEMGSKIKKTWEDTKKLRAEGVPKLGASAFLIIAAAAISGGLGGWLLARLRLVIGAVAVSEECTLSLMGRSWGYIWPGAHACSASGGDHEWHSALWGIPFVIVVFLLVEVLHIGLVGKRFSEDVREWLARLGGLILLWTLCWSLLTLLAMDGPRLMAGVLDRFKPEAGWIKWGLTTIWAAITGTGILAGKSSKTTGKDSSRTLELAGKIAPPVFILGLLLLLSIGIHQYLPALVRAIPDFHLKGWELLRDHLRWLAPPPASSDPAWKNLELLISSAAGMCLLALVIAAILSWRIGINEFSMHSFYRNRLVRCYLGASRLGKRRKQPFTGFDPADDFDLKDLANNPEAENPSGPDGPQKAESFFARAYQRVRTFLTGFPEPIVSQYHGPYLIINTALNLVGGEELAWQQRKAASFMLTPIYCGYEFTEPNGELISALQETKDGNVSLGLAVATSGAAASPNMGYHSSPALAFLMTVFNVRLGWWMGNPRDPGKWKSTGPLAGLFYLLCELLSQTNDKSGYVYLSDGGHFENLGIYELVRRHCAFILACDASEDHEMKFGDLSNAIEKCRTDFGVDIEIDVQPLQPQKDTGLSQWHCAMGRIRYDKAYPNAPVGTLVYLKSSLTGDEPEDVQGYKAQHREFPHQTTADQWFDEPQFESYRALGQHIVTKVLEVIADTDKLREIDTEDLFQRLRQHWYPPSRYVQMSFTKHTATYTRLLQKMRLEPNLNFLDQQVYPEWPKLNGVAATPHAASLWLPLREEERRAGFYLCNEVIQLMEDVYVDLHLEQEYDHPDNRGWMNLFRHWTWSGMFSATWAISASTYGARFQRFCERRLDLRLGQVEIPDPKEEYKLTKQGDQRNTALKNAEQAQVLNFWEVELIKTFLAWGRRPEELRQLPDLQVLPFEMVVESPTRDPDQEFRFAFGFALVAITAASPERVEILYLRVQNHLRKMGLARKALQKLMKKYHYRVENKIQEAPPRPLDDPSAPPEGTSKDEALPTAEAVQQFRQLFDSVKLEGAKKPGMPSPF